MNARLYLRLWLFLVNYLKRNSLAIFNERVSPLSHCVSQMIPRSWLPGSDTEREDACALQSFYLEMDIPLQFTLASEDQQLLDTRCAHLRFFMLKMCADDWPQDR